MSLQPFYNPDPDFIIKFITSIREANSNVMIPLFMEGRCYDFFLILKNLYPEAEAWYDYNEGHVYTKINKYWYDIRGVHRIVKPSTLPLNHFEGHRPHRWSNSDNRVLTVKEIK